MRKLLRTAVLAALPLSLGAQQEISLARVATGLTNPVDIQPARDGSNRLFIVQQNGVIRLLRADGTLAPTPFLDIRSKTRTAGECGLLGLAFPPDFAAKGHFYVNYTDPPCRQSTIARYRVTARGADTADPDSEQVLLTQTQPFTNHNGGGLAFGPDGFLYVGFGDGGSGGDPQNFAQNPGSLLGKMLRLDTESGGTAYANPPSNPFVSDSRFKPEIWAYGLRNPWRFSFDRETGDLWMGDVGQGRAEEINFQSAGSKGGENYGWRLMEGMACFNPSTNCNPNTNLTLPVFEYGRGEGISVTGGYVYRGSRWPTLRATYIYGDFDNGRIWGIRREGPLFNNRLLLDTSLNISTFGEDEAGEIYVANHSRGEIHRLEAAEAPRFTSRSVANAASFDLGMVPGSAAVVFAAGVQSAPGVTAASAVPLPRSLAGVTVTVNGRPAPLFAVANLSGQEQVNFQVPWETETASSARVIVTRDGLSSPSVDVPVLPLQPGIFEANSEALLVRNADNSLVLAARPLRAGEFVYFYATGLGAVDSNPGTANGGPRSPLALARTPVTVTLDGLPCEVLFAGLAPDFVGVYQINIRTPAGLRPGGGQRDLVLTAGGERSKAARITVE